MLPVNAFVKIGILYHIPWAIANKNFKIFGFQGQSMSCSYYIIYVNQFSFIFPKGGSV